MSMQLTKVDVQSSFKPTQPQYTLKKYCIDEDGNIYGVCIGSGYSFTREYYKYNLRWNINDTHGTGIVLIANEEVYKMEKTLN